MFVATSVPISHFAGPSSAQDFTRVPSPPLTTLALTHKEAAREGVAVSAACTEDAKNGTGNGGIAGVAWCNGNSSGRPYPRGGGGDPAANGTASGKSRPISLGIVLKGPDRERESNLSDVAENSDGLGTDAPQVGGTVELATKVPMTIVTPAGVSGDVVASPLTVHENLVQWRRPQRTVAFREWYISCFCNEQQVWWIEKVQRIGNPLQPLLVPYFQLWSFTGEAEFYMLFIPTTAWLGAPLSSVQIESMLWVGQYVTGIMKDAFCCPRPPCPPLQLHGKRDTHDNEYGFPSTHSCQSGVFSFFLYCKLVHVFPDHAFLCWLAAVCYFAHVSFSRIYLGMHWVGDLIGGGVVAFLTVLSHVAFLDRWEASILQRADTPWWAYLLLYVTVHLLSMAHATPHDPCPCYIDSLRFTGAVMGSTIGLWKFYAIYGTLAARPQPDHMLDMVFSLSFLMQWVVCMVVVFASRELSSLIAAVVLKAVFKFLSGECAARLPKSLQQLYLAMAKVVGLTTLGNERGSRSCIPVTANSSLFMQSDRFHDGFGQDGKAAAAAAGGRNASNSRSNTETVEEPDGYLNTQQVWSLRTHRHWWLWDVHGRTVSYAVMGFVATFVCQVLLRETFGVGQELTGPAAHHPGSPPLSPE
ncbi:hypothetical protein, conserved [Leishmania donovani]|uniref:PAP2 family protein n=1 Tax=Leishmania donovani TaxID=5661 RepID=A0A3Q8IGA4_LEIDO|nr:hypothetical protein, conserved [Leishmania donovani]AYU81788.1 sphingosine-1-phosphate phosphatase, putative [Leishmania donovani]TPP43752.1 PAP2 family protein [Leishmania donovani]CBZ36973.1 hypothetical protein, conserved [Leishmania donovani]